MDGDIIPFNADSKDIKDEVNRRTSKVGYTNRDGTSIRSNGAGKGDRFRPIDKRKYDENYARAFGHK